MLPRSSAGDTEILWCGGKSLGVFRREIKFREARRNDSPRALYGATGIVLTCLSQILTQVGLARRPGTKRSRNKMRRNDPHSVHVSENRERRTSCRVAPCRLIRGNEGEAERRNEGKKNSPLHLSFSLALSFAFFRRFLLHHLCEVTAIGVCHNAQVFSISLTIMFDFLQEVRLKLKT